jgi:hypothetical protein
MYCVRSIEDWNRNSCANRYEMTRKKKFRHKKLCAGTVLDCGTQGGMAFDDTGNVVRCVRLAKLLMRRHGERNAALQIVLLQRTNDMIPQFGRACSTNCVSNCVARRAGGHGASGGAGRRFYW